MKFLTVLLTITTLEISRYTCLRTRNVSKLADCFVGIIDNLQGTVWKMTVVASHNDTFLEDVVKRIRVPVIVNTMEQPRYTGVDTRVATDVVVVYGDMDVNSMLKGMLWHRGTRFIIAYRTITKMEEDFREFWKERVIRVFGVLEETEGVSLYSYQPYQEWDCDSTRPIRLDSWSNGTFSGDGFDLVNEKTRVNDMMGCTAKISVVGVQPMVLFPDNSTCGFEKEIDGIEARYLKVIERKFNFTGWYCTPRDGHGWGRIYPARGVVGDLYKRRSDFGFGLIAPVMERHENLELSRNYNGMECITFAVPAGAGHEPFSWMNNIKSDLRLIEWLLIVTSLAAITALFSLGTKLTPAAAFMYMFAVLVGHTVKLPKRNIFRHLMLVWIFYCTIVGDIYQASLGSRITVPVKPPEIKTFLELLESELELTGYSNMLDIVQGGRDNPLMQKIENRFIVTDFDINTAVDIMVEERKIAHIRHMSTFKYAILVNQKAKGNIRPLLECVYNYYPVIAMQKNSPFIEKVDELILQIFESGIGIPWKSYFLHEVKDIPPGYQTLSFNQSLGIFAVLLIGHSLSLIVFVAEVVLGFVKRPLRPKRRAKK